MFPHPPHQPQLPSDDSSLASAAERVWDIKELRYAIFQQHDVIPRGQLFEMMVLEKRSLPEVASALYRQMSDLGWVAKVRDRGCTEVSWI